MADRKDVYMNFFTMEVNTGADVGVLTEAQYNTGGGIATSLAWRIHTVEFYWNGTWTGSADGSRVDVAISTRKSLAALPELTDKGTVAIYREVQALYGAGTGHTVHRYPAVQSFLPPMILASPSLSLYIQGSAAWAGANNKDMLCRIGFTTEKLTDAAYREVFETWNYAN